MAPYRVDWRSPDGHWTLGKPIPVVPVKIDDREKAAYVAQRAQYGSPIQGTIEDWPAFVEPFTSVEPFTTTPSTQFSPDGKLLVSRTPTADFPYPRYDIINREGVLERQIRLNVGESIMAFGAKAVYVKVRESRVTSHLERRPWP
jgi:hypothetical protein